jgi:hypothetical protein
MPNLITVTSDIDVLFALFSRVFALYIRFIAELISNQLINTKNLTFTILLDKETLL